LARELLEASLIDFWGADGRHSFEFLFLAFDQDLNLLINLISGEM
jgi:hypothetical protein